ncbi:isopentenyl phosphate kinase [Halobacteriales archaeon Cl-PHB]
MTLVLKLGGSLITDKECVETVDEAALERAATAVGAALQDEQISSLVLVHGAGSFGHTHAARHGVSTTEGTQDASAIADIHASMGRLNDTVTAALREAGVPAVPVHPYSVAARDAAASLTLPTAAVETQLKEGFVPVLFGDVVAHEGKGATILSGDEIVTSLAESLDADRVGLCSTVPGVFDEEGDVLDRIDAFDEVAEALGGSDSTDVTGGMAGKVRSLLALSAPASVFGPDDLAAFLAGESPGTEVGSQRR